MDRPPFGLSGRPLSWQDEAANPYTQAAGARFSERLLESVGVAGGGAVVCGHSAGAGVAVELALRWAQADEEAGSEGGPR